MAYTLPQRKVLLLLQTKEKNQEDSEREKLKVCKGAWVLLES